MIIDQITDCIIAGLSIVATGALVSIAGSLKRIVKLYNFQIKETLIFRKG